MKLKFIIIGFISLLVFNSFMIKSNKNNPYLYRAYQEYFPIGTAISPEADLKSVARMRFITSHYNSITPENQMKPKQIHPLENIYNWAPADSVVKFAKKNNMKIRGHALVWFQNVPGWMLLDRNQVASKSVLYRKMQAHIEAVVKRYKKDVYCWDVVNEAISNKDDEVFRKSDPLYLIAGEEYVEMAFRYAKEADPDAQLFYNDYRFTNPIKREKIYKLLKKLKEKGVPIDGVGMQSHYTIGEVTEKYLQETIDMFSKLGLKIQVTELDISIYPRRDRTKDDIEKQKTEKADSLYTPERQKQQLELYDMLFKTYRANREKITGVTFWGASDLRKNFRTNNLGKMDYPFLFDEFMKPKKAFYKVTSF